LRRPASWYVVGDLPVAGAAMVLSRELSVPQETMLYTRNIPRARSPREDRVAVAARAQPLFPIPARACSLARAWLRVMLPAR